MTAEHDAFDIATPELHPTRTRRGLLRLAVGALAMAGIAAIAGADADAEAKANGGARRGNTRTGRRTVEGSTAGRGKDNGKGKRARCRPGKAIARIDIPANGRPIETPVLEKGRTYRLRAGGFVGLADADGGPALNAPAVDADYGFFRQEPPRPNDRVGGLDWGVAVDGKVPAWGAFDGRHEYAIVVAGRGRPLTLELVYGDEFAPDGQGLIAVAVECA